jgi:hypothetical protein
LVSKIFGTRAVNSEQFNVAAETQSRRNFSSLCVFRIITICQGLLPNIRFWRSNEKSLEVRQPITDRRCRSRAHRGRGGHVLFQIVPAQHRRKKSFPQIDGEIQAAGLDGPVDIYRDAMGIPHIYASHAHDLFFAQGYVHAQDRFWQMDFWRHIGSGRLSEMFGEGQVETDMFLRTLGWRDTLKRNTPRSAPTPKPSSTPTPTE